jgi:hypothetical protein
MSFIIAFILIFLFFVYFYIMFRWMGRSRGRPRALATGESSQTSRSPTVAPMTMEDLHARVQKWMRSRGFQSQKLQDVDENSKQELFKQDDPILGQSCLVFMYLCGDRRSEVPVEFLLQFRDFVRMMAYSRGIAVTNGGFPSDTDKLFEEAPVIFLHIDQLQTGVA